LKLACCEAPNEETLPAMVYTCTTPPLGAVGAAVGAMVDAVGETVGTAEGAAEGSSPSKGKVRAANVFTGVARTMALDEWLRLLTDAGILCRVDPLFSRHDATVCFAWGLPHVVDEIRSYSRLKYLSYVDFLEALARIITFKRIPPRGLVEKLTNHQKLTLVQTYRKIRSSANEMCLEFAQLPEPELEAEERSTAPLSEPLDMLLELFLRSMDEAAHERLLAHAVECITAHAKAEQTSRKHVKQRHLVFQQGGTRHPVTVHQHTVASHWGEAHFGEVVLQRMRPFHGKILSDEGEREKQQLAIATLVSSCFVSSKPQRSVARPVAATIA